MSVFILALHKERRILFKWRCISTSEARGIVNRLYTCFGHCLSISTPTDRTEDDILFIKSTYDKVVNYTYEQNKYWYIDRNRYEL